MAWTPLKDRIDKLPLILAGPILRRVEPDAVTVWVALKERRAVSLTVWEWNRGGLGDTKLLSARTTIKLAEHLHVVAVTAVRPPGLTPLEWGKLYCYNLFFDPPLAPGTGPDLFGPEVLVADKDLVKAKAAAMELLTYNSTDTPDAPTLPSFALPPAGINQLHIVHGSCRKPDSEGRDALPALDVMIKKAAADPTARPHLLFLTGDQIYADGVADTLLTLLSDGGDCLLAWDEALPDFGPSRTSELMAGRRATIANKVAGLTSGYDMKSHLLKLGEFYAMYLFAWSDVLWSAVLPGFEDVYPGELRRHAHAFAGSAETRLYAGFSKELRHTEDFRASMHRRGRGTS